MKTKLSLSVLALIAVTLFAFAFYGPVISEPKASEKIIEPQESPPEPDTRSVPPSVPAPSPSVENLVKQAKPYAIQGQEVADWIHQYRDLSNQQIRNEIRRIEADLKAQQLIEKSNQGNLNDTELATLTASIRRKVALHQLLLERRLKEIEARI